MLCTVAPLFYIPASPRIPIPLPPHQHILCLCCNSQPCRFACCGVGVWGGGTICPEPKMNPKASGLCELHEESQGKGTEEKLPKSAPGEGTHRLHLGRRARQRIELARENRWSTDRVLKLLPGGGGPTQLLTRRAISEAHQTTLAPFPNW